VFIFNKNSKSVKNGLEIKIISYLGAFENGGAYLAFLVRANVANGQQAGGARGAAEAARAGARGAGGPPRPPLAELHHRLERARVGQRQHPEQLRATTTLVQIHFDRLLLFFAHLQSQPS